MEQILARDTSHVDRLMDGDYAPLHLAANDDCVENIRLLVLNVSDSAFDSPLVGVLVALVVYSVCPTLVCIRTHKNVRTLKIL